MIAALCYSLLAAALGGSFAYLAAPMVLCRTDRALRSAMPPRETKAVRRTSKTIPVWLVPIRTKAARVVEEAGYRAEWAWKAYLAGMTMVPGVLMVIGVLAGRGIGASLGLVLLVVGGTRAMVASRASARSRALTRNAYKAYRFLDAQIGSGIRATDAVRGLHEVMDDREVREVFVRFVAAYELTLDLERSLDELRRSFRGYDCEMLCVGIRQCIDTGGGGRMLWRMEEIMFSKYFNGVQKETEGVRTRLVAAALLSASPLVMLFLLPVLYDAYAALGSLFS
jgi:Flp pilus assembly protein TadB